MQPDSDLSSGIVIEVETGDRWQIYRRLQELNISCDCRAYQPLRAEIRSSLELILLWSVVRQFDAPKADHVEWLRRCWRRCYSQRDRL
jgi:hypothetical protein